MDVEELGAQAIQETFEVVSQIEVHLVIGGHAIFVGCRVVYIGEIKVAISN